MGRAPDAPGMRGYRSRDASGPLRQKRGDTHMGTIEKEYNRNFNVRSDMRLDTYLKQVGKDSLKEIVDKK